MNNFLELLVTVFGLTGCWTFILTCCTLLAVLWLTTSTHRTCMLNSEIYNTSSPFEPLKIGFLTVFVLLLGFFCYEFLETFVQLLYSIGDTFLFENFEIMSKNDVWEFTQRLNAAHVAMQYAIKVLFASWSLRYTYLQLFLRPEFRIVSIWFFRYCTFTLVTFIILLLYFFFQTCPVQTMLIIAKTSTGFFQFLQTTGCAGVCAMLFYKNFLILMIAGPITGVVVWAVLDYFLGVSWLARVYGTSFLQIPEECTFFERFKKRPVKFIFFILLIILHVITACL